MVGDRIAAESPDQKLAQTLLVRVHAFASIYSLHRSIWLQACEKKTPSVTTRRVPANLLAHAAWHRVPICDELR
jgi:hypothetical protein